jgi:NADH dehydrogenase [ubiquinone] 1 alpha subcomplex assembly factor 1
MIQLKFITSTIFLLLQHLQPMILYNFSLTSQAHEWIVVDDVVMGGKSNGSFRINDANHGIFEGNVSLENNGGFSSVRHWIDQKKVENFTKVVLDIKGDGNPYQFRIKANKSDYYSYVAEFNTTSDWVIVEIPFNTMYPSFRGQRLDAPNFPGKLIEEIAFLIGNKKAVSFKLEIDKITLE